MLNLCAIDPLLLKVLFKCLILASCPINKCTFLDRLDLFVVTKGLALSWMWNIGGKRQLGYKCPDSRAHSMLFLEIRSDISLCPCPLSFFYKGATAERKGEGV